MKSVNLTYTASACCIG